MASTISAMYDALAATSITVGTTSVSVKDADELPNSVPSGTLPMRLLTVMNTNGTEFSLRSDQISGATASMPTVLFWQIGDVLLWRKIGTGIGVKAHSKELVAYAAKYVDMVRGLTDTLAKSVQIVDARAIPYNYPEGSDDWFYSFVVTLEIKEDV